jgi:hypothetical protein
MVCVILPEMSLLVYMYMTTGDRREGVREGVGETGEKERKE